MLILGTMGAGKSEIVLPALIQQDIEDKRAGVTVVVGDKENAMLLYALAKRTGRDVHIIKPSLTDSGQLLLQKNAYQYNSMKEDIIDFERAIRKKEVVIIDMEYAVHQEKSIQAVAYLLHSFREAMVQENATKETLHYLYVDDSHFYMPYVKPILLQGREYGVGCILALESRQLLLEEERAIVDAFIRNKMILNGLTISDAKHVAEDIYERQLPFILNRDNVDFIYATLDKNGRRTNGVGRYTAMDEALLSSLRLAVPRYRGNIERSQVGITLEEPSVDLKQTAQASPSVPKVELNTTVTTISDDACVTSVESSLTASKEPKRSVSEKRERDRFSAKIRQEKKRHVVILNDVFGDEDEF